MLKKSGPGRQIVSWGLAIGIHLLLLLLEFDLTQIRVDRDTDTPIVEVDYVERLAPDMPEETAEVYRDRVSEEPVEDAPQIQEHERHFDREPEPEEKLVDRSDDFSVEDEMAWERDRDIELEGLDRSEIESSRAAMDEPSESERELIDREYQVARDDLPFEVHEDAGTLETRDTRVVPVRTGDETTESSTQHARASLEDRQIERGDRMGDNDVSRQRASYQERQHAAESTWGSARTRREEREIVRIEREDPQESQREEEAFEEEESDIFQITGPLSDRRILNQYLPAYPDWAKRERITASCRIAFEVTPDGNIRDNMYVTRSSGYPQLDRITMAALKEWRFEPIDESRVEQGNITFYFRAVYMRED